MGGWVGFLFIIVKILRADITYLLTTIQDQRVEKAYI